MKYDKTVKVAGVTWNVLCRDQRSATYKGRHFFACRCNAKRPWSIHEHDQNIAEAGTAKPIRVFVDTYGTGMLSHAVREICGETPDLITCRSCYGSHHGDMTHCPYCGHEHGDQHPWITHEQWRESMRLTRTTKEAST